MDKQEQSNQNEPPTSENRNTTHPNNTEQTLTQELKIHLENFKGIMNEKKTPTITKKQRMENSQDGKGKINQVLIYISTKNNRIK